MIVYHKNQGYKLTIAAWAMAADALGVELSDLGQVDGHKLMWEIIINAARYHDISKGRCFSNQKAKKIKKRLYREQLKKELKGSSDQTGFEKISKALDEVAADIKKKEMKAEN